MNLNNNIQYKFTILSTYINKLGILRLSSDITILNRNTIFEPTVNIIINVQQNSVYMAQ